MVIHHDKMAYGRLASSREDLSEEKLAEMLKRLNCDEREEEKEQSGNDGERKEGEESGNHKR